MNATDVGLPAGLLPAFDVAWHGPIVALVLALSCLVLLNNSSRDDWHKLAGPPAASLLLGHLPQMNVQNVHRFFQDACQQYGAEGLYKIRLLNKRCVIVCDPTLVQTLVSRSSDLPKAPEIYDTIDMMFSKTGMRSFFNTHDYEEWRLVRKCTAPAFSPDNIRKAFPLALQVTNELCDMLAAKVRAGEPVIDVDEAAMRITLDVIGSTGYGYDFKARSYSECEMFDVIPPLLAEFTLRSTNPLRALKHRLLPFSKDARLFNQRVEACHKWWKILLKNVRATDLDAAAAAGDTSLRVCFAKMADLTTGQLVSDDLLYPNLAVYLVAGFETTAHSISWSLYEIAANPEVQRKVASELAAAGLLGASARQLAYADLAQLAYLNMVLKEAMRVHPVASTGTIRKANKDMSLAGYRLAPGTILWAPFITLLTSKHNWERAEEFWPERWMQLEGQQAAAAAAPAKGAAGATPAPAAAAAAGTGAPTAVGNSANPTRNYLPFSDGPRDCIGQNLALMEARCVLAAMCGRFELTVAPQMGSREDVRADEVMMLTLQCSKGILLQLNPRA